MKTLKTNSGKGKILKEILGNVTCTKYEGEFSVPSLQERSETGMWYTSLSGNPFVIQGEGNTPEDAIKDSIVRTKDYIENMEIGLDLLTECDSVHIKLKELLMDNPQDEPIDLKDMLKV